MGIVAKQSARNTVALAAGLLLGAVNTMYVLPKAFEGFEEGWGLLRILSAWGTILAQVLALGTPSTMLRFLPQAQGDTKRENAMLSTLLILPAAALALVGVASTFVGSDVLLALDANAGWLLQDRMGAFLFMASAYLAMFLLRAALVHRMRTVVVTVIQEVWLKGTYLALAVVYLKASCRLRRFLRGSCTATPRLWCSCFPKPGAAACAWAAPTFEKMPGHSWSLGCTPCGTMARASLPRIWTS